MGVYETNTDEENIRLIREENDNAAFEYLIKKYMGIVKKESRALYIIGAENEDIIQEGMIGLIKAIRSFDGSKGASFFYICKSVYQATVDHCGEAVEQEEAFSA